MRRRRALTFPAAGTVRLPAPRPEPEERVIDVYFDFTCPYSRRTGRWWRELDEPARWRPFLLREHHRDDDGPAEWERDDALAHPSVLALALYEAVDAAGGDTASYRWRAIDAFDAGQVDGQALRALAADAAGQDLDGEALREGLARLARSHQDAVDLQVFGTPTLVDGGASGYLKLAEQPTRGRARAVHAAVLAVLAGAPEVAEIKRPG
jgi:protein-disulfide isomerase